MDIDEEILHQKMFSLKFEEGMATWNLPEKEASKLKCSVF